jgi:hypothetical protein
MSLPVVDAVAHATVVANLAQQMMDLKALRRAVHLQTALRAPPKRTNRSARRAAHPARQQKAIGRS